MEQKREMEILLVEDNSNDAEMTIRALRKNNLGNNIIHVEDGEEALDYVFCRGKYDNRDCNTHLSFIMLDLKLPKVDGLEVLKILKSDPDKKIIPVVVLTSSTEEIDVLRSYKLGANSYIVKPVDFSQFVNAIKDIGLYWLVLNEGGIK